MRAYFFAAMSASTTWRMKLLVEGAWTARAGLVTSPILTGAREELLERVVLAEDVVHQVVDRRLDAGLLDPGAPAADALHARELDRGGERLVVGRQRDLAGEGAGDGDLRLDRHAEVVAPLGER